MVVGGRLLAVVLATCNGPWLTLMQGAVRCGTTSIDGACGNNNGGSTWLAAHSGGLLQHGWNLLVRYNIGDGASDNLGLPAR
jgi:hypothetical protein